MADQRVPLSVTQEAMWVTWQLDPGKWEHVIPVALAAEGDLDLPQLRAAVAQLGRRHPVLRARVRNTPEGMALCWADAAPIPVTVRTVTGPRDQAIVAARSPFDLDRGPLARVEVLTGPEYTVLLITVHHIVLDGTSTPILLDDLRRAYAGEDLGQPEGLAPLVEHARRSREAADGTEGESLRAFWRDALRNLPPARLLPARAAEDGTDAAEWPHALGPVLSDGVRRLAKDLGVSYFTVLLGALFVTLHHHTGSDDLIVSAPYHGRSDEQLRDRVGFFVNVLPFRQRLSPSDSYRQILRSLHATVRAGLTHGELPLPAILRTANLLGPSARDRTHQVVFQYWNSAAGSGVDVFDFELVHGSSRCALRLLDSADVADYRLTVMLTEGSTGSRMLWKDPAGTVGQTLLGSLARDQLAVLADMVADPDRTLAAATARLPAVVLSAAAVAPAAVPEVAGSRASDATVAALCEIWGEVLRIPDITADDSFFELGGHSLLAAGLLARITDRLGVELSVRELFGHPRLGDLAGVIDSRSATPAAPVCAEPAALPESGWGEVFPASGFQESIWLAERLDPDHARYHVPLSWQVSGELDPAVLRSALALLVSRHEILRTRFVDRDGRLFHEVGEPWVPALEQIDLSGTDEDGQRQRLLDWSDTAARSFAPSDGELLAAALFDLPDCGQVLSLCLHHLVLDGESVPVLVRELELCYRQAADPALPVRPAPPQYRDLVLAQRTASGEATATTDLAYWHEHLHGAPSSLGLAEPAAVEAPGNISLPLAPELAQRLAPVQAEWKASQFMIEAAALAAVLHRWSGLADLTFGVPVASRTAGAFEDVLGPWMNTLVLRSRCEPGTTFADLLSAIREEVIGAFEHRSAPFEQVVRRLRPARAAGRTPYVDCVLNSVSMSRWSGVFGEARVESLHQELRNEETSKFALTVTFTETPGALQANLAHRGDRISARDAERLAGALADVLNRFEELLTERVSALRFQPSMFLPEEES